MLFLTIESHLEIIWLKQCLKDFADFSEEEFIETDAKLRNVLSQLYQNTSSVGGTNLRRLRVGKKRLFLRLVENKVYCVGYKLRDKAYNKNQLREMDKVIKKILSGEGL
jgi:mRNA-degrading endonuclease RelE of RelBE toxin-antitoxin system